MFQAVGLWLRAAAQAKNFGAATLPWPDVNARTGAFFPSLLMKDDRTVVVLASFISHGQDEIRTVVRWIEGKLLPLRE